MSLTLSRLNKNECTHTLALCIYKTFLQEYRVMNDTSPKLTVWSSKTVSRDSKHEKWCSTSLGTKAYGFLFELAHAGVRIIGNRTILEATEEITVYFYQLVNLRYVMHSVLKDVIGTTVVLMPSSLLLLQLLSPTMDLKQKQKHPCI